jgi:SAM-dependent methyltransferase
VSGGGGSDGSGGAGGAAGGGKRNFLDTSKVAEFWNQARKQAEEDQQTGLQDEWPAALGANRLRGEWAQVSRWMGEYDVPRGACLDVGCGSGVWLERLAPRFERAHGIDLSSEMVASARAHLARKGIPNATVECQGAMELPDAAQYDLIFVGGVLMYLNDDVVAEMVAKLRRMLTPRGLLILRESTSSPEPWYRDKPLSPGLFAVPGQPRPPYFAIYRKPETYRELAAASGLRVVYGRANRDYKLADQTESALRLWNKLSGGALARDRARAERAAERIYQLRWLLLLPLYYVTLWFFSRTWKINNHWYLCQRDSAHAPSLQGDVPPTSEAAGGDGDG